MSSRLSSALLILLGLSLAPSPQDRAPSPESRAPSSEWRVTGGDPGATRHSPLTQITKGNVARLDEAWSFDTGANNLQVTPIVAGGVMYLTAASTVFAIAPETGKELWRFAAPGKVSRRGVASWPGDGTRQPRLYFGHRGWPAGGARRPHRRAADRIRQLGIRRPEGGTRRRRGLPSCSTLPQAVYQSVPITGGSNSEGEPSRGLYGDIRGWDARDGRLLWTFHTVPRAGERGRRDLGRGELEEPLRRQRLDLHHCRRRTRPGVCGNRRARLGFLRRAIAAATTSTPTAWSRSMPPPAR